MVDKRMVEDLQTEFHGGLQKIFRLDFYYWHLRKSIRTSDWQGVRDHLESLWMELDAWMTPPEQTRFLKLWKDMQEEYAKLRRNDRQNTFKAKSLLIESHLRGITKAHGLDMKEQKPYSSGGAIWQG